MNHPTQHSESSQGMTKSDLIATLVIMFAPSALTLIWVIHLASGGR